VIPNLPAASAAGQPADWLTPGRFAVLLALLVGSAFPGVVLGVESFFHRDFGVLAYPTVVFHREAFWRGEVPLWNPLSHCGVPFLAQWGTMPLYPGALLYLLLPLPWSLNLFCLAHLWLGGWGLHALARRWGGDGFAAALAGVVFTFNGLAQACLIWPNYTVALGWMPWAVLLAERAAVEGGRLVPTAALVLALQLLAGAPELAGMTWLAAISLACVAPTPGAAAVHEAARNFFARRLGRLGSMLGLALALCAAQLLPFFDLLAQSQRATVASPEKWALPIWGWANLLAPLFRCEPTIQGAWFQQSQQFFGSLYLGAGVLTLAGLAPTRDRTPRVWCLLGLALLGYALAVGEASPLQRALGAVVPGWSAVRYPVKFILLTAFAAPLLAAPALAQLRRAPRPVAALAGVATTGVLALGGVLAWSVATEADTTRAQAMGMNTLTRLALLAPFWLGCAAWLRAGRWRRQWPGGLLALAALVVDYRLHLPHLTPTLPAGLLQPRPQSQAGLPRPGDGRVFITPAAEAALLHSRVADFTRDFAGKRLALWSNLNLLEGVAKVNGAATLRPRPQVELEAALYAATNAPDLPLLDFLGVTHCSAPGNPTEWVRRDTANPLVTAGQEPVFLAGAETLAAVLAADFDPRREVVLSPEVASRVTAKSTAQAGVKVVSLGANRIEFVVQATEPVLAVVAQTWHPNWRARVGGNAAPVWRANHAFQAVAVPPGVHRVELRYVDHAFRVGTVISALTAAALAGLGVARRKAAMRAAGNRGWR